MYNNIELCIKYMSVPVKAVCAGYLSKPVGMCMCTQPSHEWIHVKKLHWILLNKQCNNHSSSNHKSNYMYMYIVQLNLMDKKVLILTTSHGFGYVRI